MPGLGFAGIRQQTSQLNVSKGGSTALFVDRGSSIASDKHDGYSWDRPKLTIMGALADAEEWTEIYIRSGVYAENVIVQYENTKIHGVVQAGASRVEIAPLTGVPLTSNVGYLEVEGVSLVSTNASACILTGPGHKFHDDYVEVNSDGVLQHSALVLDDCDSIDVHHSHFNGMSGEDTIGIRVDGTINPTVDAYIHECYLQDFGAAGVTGQCINLDNAQRALIIKNIMDSSYNGVYCEVLANSLHTIIGNQFYANTNYDVYDANPVVEVGGIRVHNNFYGYSGWYSDINHDGIADYPIVCGVANYDYAPLSSPHFLGQSFIPRQVA